MKIKIENYRSLFPLSLKKSTLMACAGLGFGMSGFLSTASGNLNISTVPTLDKISQDQIPDQGLEKVELHAARGEGESVQFVLSAKKKKLENIRVEITPFTAASGANIKPELHLVGYMDIQHPTPDGYGKEGRFPDILRPMRAFDVEQGESQAIWITVWVPQEAAPGDYKAVLSIDADSQKQTIEIPLKVYDTVLPRKGILKTHFGYSPWHIRKPNFYGENWVGTEVEKQYLKQMLDYRMTYSMSSTLERVLYNDVFSKNEKGEWVADWAKFDALVEGLFEEGNNFFYFSSYPMPYFSKANVVLEPRTTRLMGPELTKEDRAQILRLLNTHLLEKRWAGSFALKLVDEPSLNEENIKIFRETADFVHAHAPNLPLMIVTTDTRETKLAEDRPLYLWVPHLPSLHLSETYEDFLKERQKIGEQAWTYICVTRIIGQHRGEYVGRPFPDIGGIDRTGAAQRVFGILAWRNRLDGFLYWDAADWRYSGGYDSPDNMYKGEGVLFYPDLENLGVPFPSMRAAALRDGFEDHDLLYLLHEKITKIEENGDLSEERKNAIRHAKKVLDVDDLAPNLRDFNRDAKAYETKHIQILQALQSLN